MLFMKRISWNPHWKKSNTFFGVKIKIKFFCLMFFHLFFQNFSHRLILLININKVNHSCCSFTLMYLNSIDLHYIICCTWNNAGVICHQHWTLFILFVNIINSKIVFIKLLLNYNDLKLKSYQKTIPNLRYTDRFQYLWICCVMWDNLKCLSIHFEFGKLIFILKKTINLTYIFTIL